MKPTNPNGNQGEGDRVSARHYNKAAREFAADETQVEKAARDAASYVEAKPEEAKRAERAGKAGPHGSAKRARRGPRGTRVSVDELVAMGRSIVDRVKPYVDRAIARVKARLAK